MTTFNGGSATADVANAATGVITGFTSGVLTPAQMLIALQDETGDTFSPLGGADTIVAGSGDDIIQYLTASSVSGLTESIDGGAGSDEIFIDVGAGVTTPVLYNFRSATIRSIERLNFEDQNAGGPLQLFQPTTVSLRADQFGNGGLSSTLIIDGAPNVAAGGVQPVIAVAIFMDDPNQVILDVSGVTFTHWAASTTQNSFTINGNALGNNITGAVVASVINGLDGNDTLSAAGAFSTIDGGTGRDTITYGGASTTARYNVVLNNSGAGDVSTVGIVSISFLTLVGIENVTASIGLDSITGGNQDNLFDGGASSDTLSGGGGNDTLIGGAGADVMLGGTGADQFLFNAGDLEPTVTDTISDYLYSADTIRIVGPASTYTVSYEVVSNNTTVSFASGANLFLANAGPQIVRLQFDTHTDYWDTYLTGSWRRYTDNIDTSGRTTHQTGVMDDGRTYNEDYDEVGNQSWARITYWNDALARPDVETGQLDDGRVYDSDIDNGNLYSWTRIDYWRDALGRSDVETGFLDDGRTYNSDLDNGDLYIWDRIDNWADSLGRLDYQNGKYDSNDPTRPGWTWQVDYDQANQFSWSRVERFWNAAGALQSETFIP